MNFGFFKSWQELKKSLLVAIGFSIPIIGGLFFMTHTSHGGQGLGGWTSVIDFFIAPLWMLRGLDRYVPLGLVMLIGFVLSAIWLLALVHCLRFIVQRKYRDGTA